MSPRILVDCTAIPAQRGGVGRYVDQVVAGLDRLGADLVLASQYDDVSVFAELAPSARVIPTAPTLRRRPLRLAWEQTSLAALSSRVGADLLWSPHYTTSVAAPVPKVVTLHDATFFSDPQVHLAGKSRFFRAATRTALRRANRCIVPSRATLEELVRFTGADPDRVRVVPHGVDDEVFRPPSVAEVDQFCAEHGLRPGRFIAFLGTLEPRKNLPALIRGWIEAFATAEKPPPLVLAGAQGWDEALSGVLDGVPDTLTVHRLGYLPLEQLPSLLGGSMLVAYPSLGEGFGLPVLEAMACGAPVLTTRRLALPEVGGDAVEYCEPDDHSIAAALAALVGDPMRRRTLALAAQERAKEFSWQHCAQGHLEVFEEAVR